jgi:hypothetical protein
MFVKLLRGDVLIDKTRISPSHLIQVLPLIFPVAPSSDLIASPHLNLAIQPPICHQTGGVRVEGTQVDTRVSHLSIQEAQYLNRSHIIVPFLTLELVNPAECRKITNALFPLSLASERRMNALYATMSSPRKTYQISKIFERRILPNVSITRSCCMAAMQPVIAHLPPNPSAAPLAHLAPRSLL